MRHEARVRTNLEGLCEHRHQAGVVQEVLIILCSNTRYPLTFTVIPAAQHDTSHVFGDPCCVSADGRTSGQLLLLEPCVHARVATCMYMPDSRAVFMMGLTWTPALATVHAFAADTCAQRTLVVLSHRA
jgi:hypothetical protein